MEKYTILQRIGSGSYGIAYLGREKSSGDLYVLKEIDAKQLSETEVRKIAIEIKVLASMNHEFIVRYHDYCKRGSSIFIVMKYCQGGDLHDRIKKQNGKLFSSDVVFKWFLQTALVLHYLHSKKNDNIKVGDFGISRVLQFTQDMAQTAVGTPLYVAPEVVRGVSYDAKADVWSMGCTFYEILTLTPPFAALSLSDLMGKVKAGRYTRIHGECDSDLKELVQWMLEVNPLKRPSIQDILMKPCCLKRIEELFPRYIHTFLPYTTPVFSDQQPDTISHASQSTCTPSVVSRVSQPSRVTYISPVSSPNRQRLETPSIQSVSSNQQSKPSITRSSPSVVLHRVRDKVNESGISDIDTDQSSVSNPRRASLPSRPSFEVIPLVRRVSVGDKEVKWIQSPTRNAMHVMETVEEHLPSKSPAIPVLNRDSLCAIPENTLVISPVQHDTNRVAPSAKKDIDFTASSEQVDTIDILCPAMARPAPSVVIKQLSPHKQYSPSGQSICSAVTQESQNKNKISPVMSRQSRVVASPSQGVNRVRSPVIHPVQNAGSSPHSNENMTEENALKIKKIPVVKTRQTDSNQLVKGEVGWRHPSPDEEKRHNEGLQELRDLYLSRKKR